MHFPKPNFASRLFHLGGFTLLNSPPPEMVRCVLLFAPHTSNWDYVFGLLCMKGLNMPVKVAIKEFWMKFPFRILVKPLGGVAIRRNKNSSKNQVEALADIFKDYARIALVITPEGSRSLRTEWKSGFYYIAQQAKVPIITIKGNFAKRTAEFGPVYDPQIQSFEEVMGDLMRYYANSVAKFPENFSVDQRFAPQT